MRSRELSLWSGALLLVTLGAVADARADETWKKPDQGFGSPISEAELALWDIAIETPSGRNLPEGSGTVAQGEDVYAQACQHCHGPEAQGGDGYMYGTMVGGIGTMHDDPRVLTPASMYPYAPILFDYVRRAMPLDAPQSLTPDEVYAVSAYIYHLSGLVEEDFVADAETLAALEMPNRDAFITADGPDTDNVRCMQDCDPIGTVADATRDRPARGSEDMSERMEVDEISGGGTGGQIEMGENPDSPQ